MFFELTKMMFIIIEYRNDSPNPNYYLDFIF